MLNENKKYDYKRTIRISLFDPKSYQKVGATDPMPFILLFVPFRYKSGYFLLNY